MKKVLISILSGIILSLVILISAPTHISADTLKVGILADNKPYSYLTNKKVTGFEVELSKKIAQEMDANVKFVKVSDRKKLQKFVSLIKLSQSKINLMLTNKFLQFFAI